jgi:6-pyruvoyltetrahydropterin/6-carboxytetrahydropterin synthase
MTPRGDYRVAVTKDYLVFSSAHFITFAGHRCEGLHGHNYRVRVTIEGALNQESWFVFDFVELKGIMKRLCDEIDHLVLLPLESDRVKVVEDGDIVRVSVDGKPRYTFPRRDCALLPIPNTTVEMLAKVADNPAQGGDRRGGLQTAHGIRNGSRRELRADRRVSRDFLRFGFGNRVRTPDGGRRLRADIRRDPGVG